MTVTVLPSRLSGSVAAPPSKSYAHRYLIGAALARGESRIRNAGESADVSATLGCIRALGAAALPAGDGALAVSGCGIPRRSATLFVGESGSTLRFLIPLCLLSGVPFAFSGAKRLFERPLSVYETLCREQGFCFEKTANSLTVCGRLAPGRYEIPGGISSQFATGLLFALPLLDGDSELILTGKAESLSYLDITKKVLADFGVSVAFDGAARFSVPGGQTYSPVDATVEGDASNAAFFEALALLHGDVRVTGVPADTLQGDRVFSSLAEKIGKGEEISLADCPDLAPVLMATAAERGGAVFTDTARLKLKESDRGEAMAEELRKFGARVTVEENRITVEKAALHSPAAPISSHNDHRIAMAAAVLLTRYGGSIRGAEAVEKSFPDFFERLSALGGEVRYDET